MVCVCVCVWGGYRAHTQQGTPPSQIYPLPPLAGGNKGQELGASGSSPLDSLHAEPSAGTLKPPLAQPLPSQPPAVSGKNGPICCHLLLQPLHWR